MGYRVVGAIILVSGVASIAVGGIPTPHHAISMSPQGKGFAWDDAVAIGVTDGRIAFGLSPHLPNAVHQPGPARWHVLATQIRWSGRDGGYLAFDPTGEDNTVILVRELEKGVEWEVTGLKQDRATEEAVGVVRAASGPLKGWRLDAEEVRGRDGKVASPPEYRLILSPKPKWVFRVWRIWEHK